MESFGVRWGTDSEGYLGRRRVGEGCSTVSSGEAAMAGGALALGAEGEGVQVLGSGVKEGVERGGARRLCLEATGLGRVKERGTVQGVAGADACSKRRRDGVFAERQ